MATAHQVPLHVVSGPTEIHAAIDQAMQERVRRLVVIGGDGTLQAVVTYLAESFTHAEMPAIVMLGGGRTNYTARDIGTHDRLIDTLERALTDPANLKRTTRTTLRIEQQGLAPAHGFFIAGAVVDFIIRECHRHRSLGTGPLRTGHLSTALTIIRLAMLGLIGKSGFVAPEMTIKAQGLGQLQTSVRLLLITSLHHRREFVDPYADSGNGTVRLSAVSSRAQRFWLRLLRLVKGRYSQGMAPQTGYLSGRTQRVDLSGLEHISLDGQEHDFDPALPVHVQSGIDFEFLHP